MTSLAALAGSMAMLVAALGPHQASAQTGAMGTDIPIIVLADDSDDIAIGGNSTVSKIVNTKIKEQFSRYHYYVVPKEQLEADRDLRFNLSQRMSTADLLAVANDAKASGKPEFDVRGVVIYKIFASVENAKHAKQAVIEISGEVHDADARRYIGDFGPLKKLFNIPHSCSNNNECIAMVARDKAADIAAIVADEGRKKLAMLTKASGTGAPVGSSGAGTASAGGLVTTYAFRFENFDMADVLKFKGVMESEFPDFVRAGKMTGSEPIIEYGYVSKASQNKMMEWVHIVVRDMQFGDAKVISQGNGFTIKRLGSDLPPPVQAVGGRFR